MKREQALQAHAERTRAEIDWANNPHEFQVKEILVRVPGKMIRQRMFAVFNRIGEQVADEFYPIADAANDAIGAMIADDDADRRLNRHRHEQRGGR